MNFESVIEAMESLWKMAETERERLEKSNAELLETCRAMEAFACDGIASWSLVTKERFYDLFEQVRTVVANAKRMKGQQNEHQP